MEYTTSDIILAAFLILNQQKLLTIHKKENLGIFVFDSPDLTLIRDYDLGKALVEPVSFNNEIKRLTTAVKRLI